MIMYGFKAQTTKEVGLETQLAEAMQPLVYLAVRGWLGWIQFVERPAGLPDGTPSENLLQLNLEEDELKAKQLGITGRPGAQRRGASAGRLDGLETVMAENGVLVKFKALARNYLMDVKTVTLDKPEAIEGELPPAKVRRSEDAGQDELERALEKPMVDELMKQVERLQKETISQRAETENEDGADSFKSPFSLVGAEQRFRRQLRSLGVATPELLPFGKKAIAKQKLWQKRGGTLKYPMQKARSTVVKAFADQSALQDERGDAPRVADDGPVDQPQINYDDFDDQDGLGDQVQQQHGQEQRPVQGQPGPQHMNEYRIGLNKMEFKTKQWMNNMVKFQVMDNLEDKGQRASSSTASWSHYKGHRWGLNHQEGIVTLPTLEINAVLEEIDEGRPAMETEQPTRPKGWPHLSNKCCRHDWLQWVKFAGNLEEWKRVFEEEVSNLKMKAVEAINGDQFQQLLQGDGEVECLPMKAIETLKPPARKKGRVVCRNYAMEGVNEELASAASGCGPLAIRTRVAKAVERQWAMM
eukprot:s2122_g12.t1